MRRVLLLFLDGVGAGEADAAVNPFLVARLPHLATLLDGALPLAGVRASFGNASLAPLDATLGVPGLPQSGTGQTALFTGLNAAALHGRHHGPWVPVSLRARLGEQSVLARAVAAGCDVAFANAYPEEAITGAEGPRLSARAGRGALPPGGSARAQHFQRAGPLFLRAAPPLAARAAGLLTRHTPELERGDAVASEIVNEVWRERLGRTSLPHVSAAGAGANLARIAAAHDLTVFAHYSTDAAGHLGSMDQAIAALELVDEFLGGLLAASPPELLTLVVSDHGNIEDVRNGHTRHPALGLVIGQGHAGIAPRLHAITDVVPAIAAWLRLD